MSVDVAFNSPTTTSTTRTGPSSSPELPTTTSTPMSSSSNTASTPLLSTPLLPSPLLPPTSSTSSTMTTTTTTTPTTTMPSSVASSTTIPTTTVSITITPTITITTTTSISTPTVISTTSRELSPTVISTTSRELSPTIFPTTTTTATVIPPSTSPTPTRSSSTVSRQSTSTTPIIPVTSPDGSSPLPSAEAMFSSPTRIGTVSTFSSTVYIATTDSYGSPTVYTPTFFTTTITYMDTGGATTTTTGVFANPTLNTDTSSPSTFFQNKGAIAGVFTLVGIAIISIIIWIILFIQRRRREQTFARDSAIFASLFEAGVDRIPIESESSASSRHSRYDSAEFLAIPMANSNAERHRRSTSGLLGNRRRSIMPDAYHEDRGQYDPYIEYGPRNSRDSYRDMPSPTTPHLNIPPSAFAPYRGSSDGMGMVEVGTGLPMGVGTVHARHSHHGSGSSFEPLLASHQRRNGPMPGRGPLVLDATHLSNGRASQTPSTDNGSSASTSKPSYPPSLMQPNFNTTNPSSHSAILINGKESRGSEVNLVNGETTKQSNAIVDSEVLTTEDGHELELQKPVLAVRNLPDAASTLSLS